MLWCSHLDTTAPNDDGEALCTRCGAILQVRLTPRVLAEALEFIRRDHGPYGHHSMRCVETTDGWCCASDCTLAAR